MPRLMHITVRKIALVAAFIFLWMSIGTAGAASVSAASVEAAPLTVNSSAMNGMVRVWLSSLGNPSRLDLTICGSYSLSTSGEFLENGSTVSVGFNPSTGALSLTRNGGNGQHGQKFLHSASQCKRYQRDQNQTGAFERESVSGRSFLSGSCQRKRISALRNCSCLY